jgi:hypothetical protein
MPFQIEVRMPSRKIRSKKGEIFDFIALLIPGVRRGERGERDFFERSTLD